MNVLFLIHVLYLKIVWTIKMYGCSIVEDDFRLWYLWLVIFIGLKWLKNSYVWTVVKMNTNWYLFSFPFCLGWSKRPKRNRFKVYGEFVIEVWQNVIVKNVYWVIGHLFAYFSLMRIDLIIVWNMLLIGSPLKNYLKWKWLGRNTRIRERR